MNMMPLRSHSGAIWPAGKISHRRPSEGELADRLAENHNREIRYAVWKRKWIIWNGEEWVFDTLNAVQHLARCICRDAAEERSISALEGHRTVSGVLGLAQFDPRLVSSDWSCHLEIEAAVSEWLNDRCTLDPEAWTRRSDLLASFTGWDRFDPNDLAIASAARGITHRRKGNVHGFDGVALREAQP
jgi:hypothetical protein